ncbi:MAG: hypothetical protein Q3997_03315 [Propionibacteriaceae bacterium]|nr:hypothetical protein [Propionibacteriaceae bacterium]
MEGETGDEWRFGLVGLIVADLKEPPNFVEWVTSYSPRERVEGFSGRRFGTFEGMLSESALLDIGTASGVIRHIEVADEDRRRDRCF